MEEDDDDDDNDDDDDDDDIYLLDWEYFFSPGATTPIGGCILQPSGGL